MHIEGFITKLKNLQPGLDEELIRRAYTFAERAHQGQTRESGEPYLAHCLRVATTLAEHNLDTATIAAGLLHDVAEDTGMEISQVKGEFGDGIAGLVDGVTKISGLRFQSREEQQVSNFRKMLLSMAKDIRVILIKFADRLHNMQTLEHLDKDRRIRIALETREVYAPLAHRLGMAKIKTKLEDLSLKFLDPEGYEILVNKLASKRRQSEDYLDSVKKPLVSLLRKEGIEAEITGRTKHITSIYRKIKSQNLPLEKIYDLMAIRVITKTEAECYQILGLIHTLWTPVQERFKDYIATPKSNMYQSLHTTVVGPKGEMVEIQIRTEEMHRTAEYGIAAHWLYKEGKEKPDELDKRMRWIREVMEWQSDVPDPHEFMEFLKIDLFHDDVFVFTPKGDLKRLPKGSTPLDFGFSVHSEVGLHCLGAIVNGRMVSLDTPLKNGDTVEIITSPRQKPSQDWIELVKSSRARSKIKRWLKQKEFAESIRLGRNMLERELRKNKLRPKEEEIDVAMALGYPDVNHLMAAIGQGDISLNQVIHRVLPPEKRPQKALSRVKRLIKKGKEKGGIRVKGVGNLMVRFARCCQPIPGDRIIGFVTRGRGVSIHRVDCPNLANLLKEEEERRIEVEWDVEEGQSFLTQIELLVEDKKGLLHDITKVMADEEVNIRGVNLSSNGSLGKGSILMEVKNLHQLRKVIKEVGRIKAVNKVQRSVAEVDEDG
jgi:guanosine-3',5'-bis(diphosphate) 3'-pyrophosphohydrolase